ncbi:MAG: polymerase subunit delta'''' protein [Parcubacteria group bacterium]|nr:polymerase subunit delta'''' protein [Parcubacteria group bacterium]
MRKTLNLKSIIPDSLEKLHHAYCLEGKREYILNELEEFLENVLKFKIKGNPDFYYGAFDTLGIDEGRSINEMQSRKAVSFTRRIFTISANFITRETQNSLLKMFEDPAGGAVFFLIISSASILLPTLRSRMMIINLNQGVESGGVENSEKSENIFDAKKFIKSAAGERLATAKKIADQISDEKVSRSVAVEFLNDVEKEILNRSGSSEAKKKNLFIFQEIDKCRNYAGDRSPSIKMLLEHIAISV